MVDQKLLADRLTQTFGNDTQEVIAQKILTTQGNVSKLKSGQQAPGLDTLIEISRAYKVSIDWLLGLSEQKDLDGVAVDKLTYEQVARVIDRLIDQNTIELTNEEELSPGIKKSSDYIKIKDRLLSFLMRRRFVFKSEGPDMDEFWNTKVDKYKGLRLLQYNDSMAELTDLKSPAQFTDADWKNLVDLLGTLSLEELMDEIEKKKQSRVPAVRETVPKVEEEPQQSEIRLLYTSSSIDEGFKTDLISGRMGKDFEEAERIEAGAVHRIHAELFFKSVFDEDGERCIEVSCEVAGVQLCGVTSTINWASKSQMNNTVRAGQRMCTTWFKIISRENSICNVQFYIIGD